MQQPQGHNPAFSGYQQPYRGSAFMLEPHFPMASQGLQPSAGLYVAPPQRPMHHGVNQYQPYFNQVPSTTYSTAGPTQQNSSAYQCLSPKINR